MSHTGSKDKISNVSNKHSEKPQKNCCAVNSLTANCKCVKHHNITHGQCKIKRLKSHKERSQMMGRGREASNTKSHHHHHRHQRSKNIAHFHCCHSSCYCTSRRDAPFPNRIPAAQELSIITDNRLTGHHGLFNHEVKSVDIERFLTEQSKQEKSKRQVPEKKHVILHPCSTSHNPSPFSSKDLSGADTNEVVPIEKKADPAIKAKEFCEKGKKISQGSDGSDVTPGQRLQQEPDPSSGSYKSMFSSKRSSLDVVVFNSKKTNSLMSEKGRESQLSPSDDRDNVKTLNKKLKTNVTSTLEHTPKHLKAPIQLTQAHGLTPSSVWVSSSPITESSDMTHIRQDPSSVSKSVSEVAALLCDCLHLPFLRRRNLVTESSEELLRALRERHGPRLQENLLKVQRSISYGSDLTKAMIDEDVLLPADAPACQADTTNQLCFDTRRSLRKTDEWLTDPIDTSASLLDGVLRPSCSSTFCMDSEPPGASASYNLFSLSPTSCWAEKVSTSQPWGDSFNRSKSKESFMCEVKSPPPFENSFFNHRRAVRESCGPQYSGSNIQTFFRYPAQLPGRHSAESVHFPLEPGYTYAPSFSAKIHHPNQSNHCQTFSQFGHPSTCFHLRPHNTDMMHYPPSHMLEREPAPPFSSLLIPEHWSFPPMRLY